MSHSEQSLPEKWYGKMHHTPDKPKSAADEDNLNQRALRIYQRALGKQEHSHFPRMLDDIEMLASSVREVDLKEVENYVSHPGDLMHKVGFHDLDSENTAPPREFEQWLSLLKDGTPVPYARSEHGTNATPSKENSFSAYITDNRGKNAGVSEGVWSLKTVMSNTSAQERFSKGGIGSIGIVAPGFTVVFSENMKEKLSSPEISDETLEKLMQQAQEIENEVVRAKDIGRMSGERHAKIFGIIEKMGFDTNTILQYPTIPIEGIIGMIAYYRALKKDDIEKLRRAQSLMFASTVPSYMDESWQYPTFDSNNYGVRLMSVKKNDNGKYVLEPCVIEKKDIAAVIAPVPFGAEKNTHGSTEMKCRYTIAEFSK